MATLIVEGSKTTLDLLKSVLMSGGYITVEAENAEDACLKAENNSIDLIITDYALPDGNGAELVNLLRKIPRFRSTPVIVISSDYSEETMENCREATVNALMFKPFDNQSLLKAIAHQMMLVKAAQNKPLPFKMR